MVATRLRFAVIVLAAGLAACATPGPTSPARVEAGVLTTPAGMTLYTFDRDVSGSGKSVCNGPCAANWPPFMVSGELKPTADWSIVTRDDGSRQWAYLGKPLYGWVKDTKPGDRTGDGVNNVWRVAKTGP